jgi:hypothetical protein
MFFALSLKKIYGRPCCQSVNCILYYRNYHDSVSIVNQDHTFFGWCIRENIAYGSRNDVTDEQIIEAAKCANALEFIEELRGGFDTPVKKLLFCSSLYVLFLFCIAFSLFFHLALSSLQLAYRAGMSNWRPAGRMRPHWLSLAAHSELFKFLNNLKYVTNLLNLTKFVNFFDYK